jgi:uncharacterized protein
VIAFADTAFYVAMFSPDDEFHELALNLSGDPSLRLVTTDFVLVEVANFFTSGPRRRRLPRLIGEAHGPGPTTTVRATRRLMLEGLELFSRRTDKEWSLTDCTSFVVMRRRGLRDALTSDSHFRQAGFRVLLTS